MTIGVHQHFARLDAVLGLTHVRTNVPIAIISKSVLKTNVIPDVAWTTKNAEA